MELSVLVCGEGAGHAVALARVRDAGFVRRAVDQAVAESRERASLLSGHDEELGAMASRETAALERRLASLVGRARCGRRPLHTLGGGQE